MTEILGNMLGLGRIVDTSTLIYLGSLAEHPADTLCSLEPQRLAQASHSLLLSLQALSKRSHKPIVDSAVNHGSLRRALPALGQRISELRQTVPRLETAADAFSANFGKASQNKIIARRKEALRLLNNAERLVDIMEIPPLLTSAVNMTSRSHSSTLDLYAHARRLAALYPKSRLISSVLAEAEAAIRQMVSDLVAILEAPGLKLATGLRTVGWLKRILPDLVSDAHSDDSLPVVFLVCRMMTLLRTLAALGPLRELADEESLRQAKSVSPWSGGQHTERYLKRFIEVFREHAFGIVSMSKSVDASFISSPRSRSKVLDPPSSTLSAFPLHLVGLLLDTLRTYLPNVKDQTSRNSIIIQVLYCAGSLGRLGADFGLPLAVLGGNEWADLVKRHRLLAGRLESVIGDNRGNRILNLAASASAAQVQRQPH